MALYIFVTTIQKKTISSSKKYVNQYNEVVYSTTYLAFNVIKSKKQKQCS